jgi:hypothetical protein
MAALTHNQWTIPDEVLSRVITHVKHFGGKNPAAKETMQLGQRLFFGLISLLCLGIPTDVERMEMLRDQNFQRSLVCISLEVARYIASDPG